MFKVFEKHPQTAAVLETPEARANVNEAAKALLDEAIGDGLEFVLFVVKDVEQDGQPAKAVATAGPASASALWAIHEQVHNAMTKLEQLIDERFEQEVEDAPALTTGALD